MFDFESKSLISGVVSVWLIISLVVSLFLLLGNVVHNNSREWMEQCYNLNNKIIEAWSGEGELSLVECK